MNLSILLGMIGPWQIVIIIAVVILLFGAKKIPELMKGVGKGIREFKDATKDESDDESDIEKKSWITAVNFQRDSPKEDELASMSSEIMNKARLED